MRVGKSNPLTSWIQASNADGKFENEIEALQQAKEAEAAAGMILSRVPMRMHTVWLQYIR